MGRFKATSLYIMGILGFFMISYMFITVISVQMQFNELSDTISETFESPEPDVTLDMQTQPTAPRKDCVPAIGQEDQPCP